MSATQGALPVRALVVSWNGADLLRPCLDSLLAQTARDELEVVVVDNGSADGTLELLRTEYPTVRVIASPTNLGFAGGVALGCQDFRGEAVLLLNNDAVLAPDGLERMLDVLREDAEVGAVTAKVLLAGWFCPVPPGSPGAVRARHGWVRPCPAGTPGAVRLVNSTGNVVDTWGAGHDRDWLAPSGSEASDGDVPGFCGAAALLRWSALAEVGGFDGSLFLYYEDTDVSYKLRRAGWRIRYASSALAEHRHAASSDERSPLFRYYNTRNALVVVARHAPLAVVAASLARQTLGTVRATVARAEPAPVRAARRRALRDAVLRLPRTFAERRRLDSVLGRTPTR
ncbi:glycosyltransferase family 2 protein [Cellulomonas telluris]|uniref:glycosyltransferase family 2 protein n=1 Tax=Cellulomonas telluris TaxID=2306636 RepID=UPI0014562A62|nr:glycosyltransferase family 2 protein [Cellulomonas telluris]